MVKMRQADRTGIRPVQFAPQREVVPGIEVMTPGDHAPARGVPGVPRSAAPGVRPPHPYRQRHDRPHRWTSWLMFSPQGDTMWIHAGQVQQWGDIGAIDGPVVLFTPRPSIRHAPPDPRHRHGAPQPLPDGIRGVRPGPCMVLPAPLCVARRRCAGGARGRPCGAVARGAAVGAGGWGGCPRDGPLPTRRGLPPAARRRSMTASPPSAALRRTHGVSATRHAHSTASREPTRA